jgi:hypothetical protein
MYRLHSCNRYIANTRSGDAPGRGIEGLSCGRGNWCTANGQNHGRPKSPFGWPCFSFDDVAQQGQTQEYPDVPPHLGDELTDSAHCGIDNLAHAIKRQMDRRRNAGDFPLADEGGLFIGCSS